MQAIVAATLLSSPTIAAAEPYAAVYLGAAFTQSTDLKDTITLNGSLFVDGTLRDVEFDTSVMFGGKLGYFFDRPLLGGHFGLEVEAYHFEPDAGPQTLRFQGILAGMPFDGPQRTQKADIDVTGAALNLLYRVPLATSAEFPRGRFQPYIGVGLAVLIAELSTHTTPLDVNAKVSDTDVQPAFQALAGLRTFITPNIAVFLEYKFIHSQTFTFNFTQPGTFFGSPVVEKARDRADLTSHLLSLGVGFHW